MPGETSPEPPEFARARVVRRPRTKRAALTGLRKEGHAIEKPSAST
jgi:hypothetical protein